MNKTAYLVAHIDTTTTPPTFLGHAIYSSSARSITNAITPKRFAFDVLEVSGDDYQDAVERLQNFCSTSPNDAVFGWALKLGSEQ